MSHFIKQSIQHILSTYQGDGPLSLFLKKYFSSQPQLGSRDRKAITEAIYIFFRTAPFLWDEIDTLEIIKVGYDWCGSQNEFLKKVLKDIQDPSVNIEEQNFVWEQKHAGLLNISNDISLDDWLSSMRLQPYLFIRLVGNKAQQLKSLDILKKSDGFVSIVPLHSELTVIALENSFKVHLYLKECSYVVQDLSSQTTVIKALNLIEDSMDGARSLKVWDVCAGAGGKSLLWKYLRQDDVIWTTDVRQKILNQLKKRLKLYGTAISKTLVVDMLDVHQIRMKIQEEKFDVILCDVPCSGSGTWSRTPEQFYYFKPKEVSVFSEKQLTIAANSFPYLKENGYFIYITCSVFLAENEEVVEKLQAHTGMTLLYQKLITNNEEHADSLFIALLKK